MSPKNKAVRTKYFRLRMTEGEWQLLRKVSQEERITMTEAVVMALDVLDQELQKAAISAMGDSLRDKETQE